MAIHAIGHKALGVVNMGGGLPSVVGGLNLVAGCTKLGCRSSHHRIVADAEERKSDEDADRNKNGRF